ncbi:MAG: CbtA family protein, partial [Boseongicola sp.]|nr:CbtA family protein [Boseongicola sp.]
MIFRIFSSALIAGALAGILAGLVQYVFVQPVLLHAELYESGELVHFGQNSGVSAHQPIPLFSFSRDVLSLLFSSLLFAGYALLLLPLMIFAEDRYGLEITTRFGLLWGMAGFIVLNLAPGFSMAPEVPGVAAAEVSERQVWWAVTVAFTALA